MKKCPYCAEEIQDEAIVCRFCGRDLRSPIDPPLTVMRAGPVIDAKLANLEDARRRAEVELSKYTSARNVGLLGILIGLFVAYAVSSIFGILLIAAGILATVTNVIKANIVQKDLIDLTHKVEQRRSTSILGN